MFRKIGLLAIAAAVLALAAPSLASAAQLTKAAGGAVEIGSMIEASASGKTKITIEGGPQTECQTVNYAEKLQVNSGGIVSGTGIPGTASGFCFESAFKLELLSFELKSATSGSGNVRIEITLAGGGKCSWEGAVAVTYVAGGSGIQINGSKLAGLPKACGLLTVTGSYIWKVKTLAVVLD